MATPLVLLIILLSGVICALAGYWFYRTAQERKRQAWSPSLAPQTAHRSIRNAAWDRVVRASRNRNW